MRTLLFALVLLGAVVVGLGAPASAASVSCDGNVDVHVELNPPSASWNIPTCTVDPFG